MPGKTTVEEIVKIIGEKAAVKLLRVHAGHRLPTLNLWLKEKQRKAVVASYRRGWPLPELALRYNMPLKMVKTLIGQALRARRKQLIDTGQDPWVADMTSDEEK